MSMNLLLLASIAASRQGGAAAYTQNRIQTDGVNWLSFNTGSGSGYKTSDKMEFSCWFSLDNLTAEQGLYRWGLDTFLRINTSGQIDLKIETVAGATLWRSTSSTALTTGVIYHLYMSYDAATATATILLDGVPVTMVDATAPTTGADIQMNKIGALNEPLFSGTPKFLGTLGDMWIDNPSAFLGYSAFHDGLGNPRDLSAYPTPGIFLGGSMRAADWNAGTNLGTIALVAEGLGAYTDV